VAEDFLIKNYYPRNIPLDDGFDGDAVKSGQTFAVRIRRFSVAQLKHFQRGFAQLTNPSADRFIFRKADGDEQAMREDGKTHVVPDDEIRRRRLDEMDSATRAVFDAASQADDDFMTAFCSESIAAYISVAPGEKLKAQRDDAGDTFEVKTGKDLVEAFGGNLSMLIRLTRSIHQENTLSPETKKALRSLSASTGSSPTPGERETVGGVTPAAIVTNAEPAGSVSNGGASEAPETSRSGLIQAAT
jgi:hypothetical protein